MTTIREKHLSREKGTANILYDFFFAVFKAHIRYLNVHFPSHNMPQSKLNFIEQICVKKFIWTDIISEVISI